MKVKSNEEIKEFLFPIVAPLGIEVAEVEFKQGKNPTLTVFIDKEGGVDLNACELVHNTIDAPLDELDCTYGEPYTLNVSSLGLDRPFKTDADFNKAMEKKVEVWLKTSVAGKKEYDGILNFYDGKIIRVKINDKQTLTFELGNVEKVNNYIDF